MNKRRIYSHSRYFHASSALINCLCFLLELKCLEWGFLITAGMEASRVQLPHCSQAIVKVTLKIQERTELSDTIAAIACKKNNSTY